MKPLDFFTSLSVTKCVRVWAEGVSLTKQFSDSCSNSYTSCSLTQFWRDRPRDGFRFHRLSKVSVSQGCTPTLQFWCQWQVQVVTCASKTYKLKAPQTFSSRLLERLRELRKAIHLLDYWFIIRGYNSGIAGWKKCIRPGVKERTWGCGALSGWHSPSASRCSPAQKLSELRPFRT